MEQVRDDIVWEMYVLGARKEDIAKKVDISEEEIEEILNRKKREREHERNTIQEKERLEGLLEDYVKEVHNNLSQIDNNSTITIRENRSKCCVCSCRTGKKTKDCISSVWMIL